MLISCPHCNTENQVEESARSATCSGCQREFALTHAFDTIDLPTAESRNSVTDRLLPFIKRFEKAWNDTNDSPGLDDFLPGTEPDRVATLVELIHIDLEQYWRREREKKVEDYLVRYSHLLAYPRVVFGLLATECRLRRQKGHDVDASDYATRFPHLEGIIAEKLADASSRPRSRFPSTLQCGSCRFQLAVLEGTEKGSVACPSCGTALSGDSDVTRTWSHGKLPRIGKFQLLDLAGNGAFGAVYRAHDTELDRQVAIKIPRQNRALGSEEIDQSLDEARNAARLTHPGIVPIYEVGSTDEYRYIVSEFVDGVTLSSFLSGQSLSTIEAVELLRDVAIALAHAHEKGVVHLDLKPANMMLDDNGKPRILDFGLGKRAAAQIDPELEGRVLGTPRYMSPEQAAGNWHTADGRADIYSMGVILFQLLTSELPFRGNTQMLLHQIKTADPPSLRSLNDRIPRDLETIALKCMEKEPANRYQSAEELAAELTRVLQGEPIIARPITKVERAFRWCKRRPVLVSWIGGLTSVIVVVTVIAFVLITLSRNAERDAKIAAIGLAQENKSLYQSEQEANRESLRRLRQARQAVDDSLIGLGEALQYYPGVTEIRAKLLEKAVQDYEAFAGAASEDLELETERGWVKLRLAELQQQLGRAEPAAASLNEARAIFEDLEAKHADHVESRIGLAKVLISRGLLRLNTGQPMKAEEDLEAAIARLEAIDGAEVDTADALATAHVNLGDLLLRTNRLDDAEDHLKEAVAYSTIATRGDPPLAALEHRATAHIASGKLAFQLDRFEEAVQHFKAALASYRDLRPRAKFEFPIAAAQAAIQLELAGVHRRMGDFPAERKAYEDAVAILIRLNELLPGSPYHREALALARSDLGQWLYEQGHTTEARRLLQLALADYEQLMIAYQDEARYVEGAAACLDMLSQATGDLGDLETAIMQVNQAVIFYRQLAELRPEVAGYRERLAVCRSHLAQRLQSNKENEGATQQFEAAIDQMTRLVDASPRVPSYRHLLAIILTHQGDYHFSLDDSESAMSSYSDAKNHWKAITNGDVPPEYRNSFAWFLATCPAKQIRDHDTALIQAQHAVDASPKNPIYLETLAAAKFWRGEFDSCLQSISVANQQRERPHVRSLVFEAMALAELNRNEESAAALERAREWVAENSPGNLRHRGLVSLAEESVGQPMPIGNGDSRRAN